MARLLPLNDRSDTRSYSDFLDWTVQGDRLCEQILEDPAVKRDLSHFVPQHIAVDGEPQVDDAPRYVTQWLARRQGGLLVVLAPAGYGKTVLTRVIASRLADAHMKDAHRPREPFPFLVPFGEFRRVASFESMIVTALHSRGVADVMAGAFAHLVQRRRCVLLLDGFDELLEERPEEARKNLRELLETLGPDSRVMVTARSTFFRTSTDVADFLEHGISADDVTIVDLRPFDASQRQELVQRLTTNQRTISYINTILGVTGVSEAMGSPLLLRETIEALQSPQIRSQLARLQGAVASFVFLKPVSTRGSGKGMATSSTIACRGDSSSAQPRKCCARTSEDSIASQSTFSLWKPPRISTSRRLLRISLNFRPSFLRGRPRRVCRSVQSPGLP